METWTWGAPNTADAQRIELAIMAFRMINFTCKQSTFRFPLPSFETIFEWHESQRSSWLFIDLVVHRDVEVDIRHELRGRAELVIEIVHRASQLLDRSCFRWMHFRSDDHLFRPRIDRLKGDDLFDRR